MFNNYINMQDVYDALDLKYLKKGFNKLFMNDVDRTTSAWSDIKTDKVSWYDVPKVKNRIARLMAKNSGKSYRQNFADKYLHKEKVKAISLASGMGANELEWFNTGAFSKICGYDLSPERVNHANKIAKMNGLSATLNYYVGDVSEVLKEAKKYDVVICEAALHHFTPINKIVEDIYQCVNQGGFLVVNEYVGPNRFQWSDKHIKSCNAVLDLLPKEYKVMVNGLHKKKVRAPSKWRIKFDDPSEAIESQNILSAINSRFSLVEKINFGGSLLHPLLTRIAHNFLDDSEETNRTLELVFSIEDYLYETNTIEENYIFGIYTKK